MNQLSIIGATLVTLALISYSIGILTEQIKRKLIRRVLIFITSGVVLDISATIFMILGSRNSPFTLHGIIGYSALFLMLIELFLIWRNYSISGLNAEVTRGVHRYSRFAYIWWIVAYVTGSVIAMS